MKQLSIIVPVYNVELYIRPCVESIFRQGLREEDFEVILVNDGTQDNSFGVIEDIIEEHNNVIVLEQLNQGLSMARNNGLVKACGQYVLFLDSDDLLVDNTLSRLLSFISGNTIDLLIAELIKLNNADITLFNGIQLENCMTEIKSAKEAFLFDFNPKQCYACRILYRRMFLIEKKLQFIPGIFFEDVPFTTECYLRANQCIKTSLTFYIYRQRENSIVSSINIKKIFDMNTVIAHLWKMKQTFSLPLELQGQLMNTIFTTFSIAVWYITHDDNLLKQSPSYVSDLKQKVPDLHFSNGIKQKMVSFFYRIAPLLYIKLRSFL